MPKSSRNTRDHKLSFLPQWLLWFFALATVLLVPWTIVLSQSLPSVHVASHWNLSWIGFDISLVFLLGVTAFLGLRKSGWVIVPASVVGALLLVDAWFDCLNARPGWEHGVSLSLAFFIEVPLAFMAFWIAYRAGKHYLKKK